MWKTDYRVNTANLKKQNTAHKEANEKNKNFNNNWSNEFTNRK